MQAVILAGGFGTRLAPLTYTKAKSMLPLLNKPMISYIISALPKGTEIVVAANYRNEEIQEFLDKNGINGIVNKEEKPLGTAGAVKNAEKYIDGTFLVLNSDIISSLNIRKFVQYHMEKRAFVTISLWPVENVEEYGVVDIKKDGRITKFVEKPPRHEAPSNLINAGAYCLEYEVLDYIEDGVFVSMEMDIFPRILEEGRAFYGYNFNGYWIDVGRPESYIKATRILLGKEGLNYKTGNSEIRGKLMHSVVGDNCIIDEGSILNSCIIYDGCRIGKNVRMENCIVADECIIRDGAILKDVVIGKGEKIEERAEIENKRIWSKPLPPGYPEKQIGNPVRG